LTQSSLRAACCSQGEGGAGGARRGALATAAAVLRSEGARGLYAGKPTASLM
jgi:hypothetical protein